MVISEFELILYRRNTMLAARPKQIFTREQIIEKIWGYDYEGDERTVDVGNVIVLLDTWSSK
jgi:DNA-binding response OmpR family regulator